MASTPRNLSSTPSSPADESRWVVQIRALVEEEVREEDMKTPVSIFCVPRPMVSFRPHAYVPQLFAFGPYHHWHPQLYDMERYKLATARRTQERLRGGGGLGFEDVVELFEKREFKLRCHYHKYLDLSAKTLAWMMAIDTSFLLNFLQNNYSDSAKPEFLRDATPARTLSKMIAKEKTKLGHNMLRRDILMLENQIPFFLLKKLNRLLHPSKQSARVQLSKLLAGFVRDTSPFKTPTTQNGSDDAGHAHLLDLLYRSIVPEYKQLIRRHQLKIA
ncbi:uncharacterized protein A4U43_C01F1000 [Asparagus officinalis]|uniref:Uncharacterized protein n=1 Tax=Asparagus officinalis TaxID=4686 RepID=A0A5P1FPL3_ASPOF|nr:uncharacterized protein A4U43_C01F1000 [Asparagus officinalis]